MTVIVSDHATVYGGFTNEGEWHNCTYDFAIDAGATGDYTLFTAGEDLVVLDFYADVQTAVTSGGSLTADLGTDDPSAATGIWSNMAVASMALDAVLAQDTRKNIRIASAGKMTMTLEAATALTGKIKFWFLLKKQ